ncbi:glycosyltransferase [Planktothrix sp. FACHB-1355]|uniref:Glycosyltransferase n=1 Tax=Aerosakkonema funiforme FACHB-1375 TaxID=2949571 RepID=A0A926VGA5_9CYAN|nr:MULTISPECIES: glycosyltransferase [Oscillatoriales]MBD2183178.1 glycosyltransferase [Aerosakkonema funiforme FACHB-1375]MBD3562897.1 glycosyltransferase [Planktothrix sp. FACHB-1355]
MNSYPLVSICIPLYNGAEFIPSLITSLQQTTYPNIEIIISDDGSKDEGLRLLRVAELPNTHIFTHARYGLVPNWNYCIEQAKGKYVKFLFQDDTLTGDCIAKMVQIAEPDEEIGLVFSTRQLIYEQPVDLKFLKGMQDVHKHWSKIQPIQSGLSFLQDENFFKPPYNKVGEPTNVLIRREVFERVGLFDANFKQLADLEMWLRIMAYYKIGFIDERLAAFRIHPNQATSLNLDSNRIDTLFEIYKVWLKIIFNKTYQSLPSKLRKKMRRVLVKILLIKGLKSIILLRWEQVRKVTALLKEVLRRKPEPSGKEFSS